MTESPTQLNQIGSIYYRERKEIPAIGETLIFIRDGKFTEGTVVGRTTVQKETNINNQKAFIISDVPIIRGINYTSIILLDEFSHAYHKNSLEYWECKIGNKPLSVTMENGETICGKVKRVMLRGDFPHDVVAIIEDSEGNTKSIIDLKRINLVENIEA